MDVNYDTCNNLVVQEFISEAQTCVKCPGLMYGSSLLQTGHINPLDSAAWWFGGYKASRSVW